MDREGHPSTSPFSSSSSSSVSSPSSNTEKGEAIRCTTDGTDTTASAQSTEVSLKTSPDLVLQVGPSPTLAPTYRQYDEVKINVGGKIFQTRVCTLTTHSTFFRNLFKGGDSTISMQHGKPLFLDHDPRAFELILNYFRYQRIDSLIHFLSEPTRDEAHFCRKCIIPLQYEGKRINVRQHPKYGDPCWNHVCVGCGSTVAWSGAGTWHWTQSVGQNDPLVVSARLSSYEAEDIGASVKSQLRYFQVCGFEFLEYPSCKVPVGYRRKVYPQGN